MYWLFSIILDPLSRGLRASPLALVMRDDIFDNTLAPIWYYDEY